MQMAESVEVSIVVLLPYIYLYIYIYVLLPCFKDKLFWINQLGIFSVSVTQINNNNFLDQSELIDSEVAYDDIFFLVYW